ncbi:helix-turn-helix transcriptional regulator [uncultured Clostridium sp.]|uniref:helix-turn-helix domain-containing protein n=1 Tax=uncultured Clostridium sp. TaxID=59620 RepID=UPI0025F3D53E|nr:helix-turn-helix transcriptional regulator [uncultured Clostridium sp.]
MLGKKIKALRKNKGYTLRALAEKCDINFRTIKAIEDGKSQNPGIYTIKRIADVFNVSLDYLVNE